MTPVYRPGLGDDTGREILAEFGRLEYRLGPGDTCEIVNIEVDNRHRREGVGRRLVEQLVRELRALHLATRVYAFARVENRIACDFWRGVGFTRRVEVPGFYAGGTAVLFIRDI